MGVSPISTVNQPFCRYVSSILDICFAFDISLRDSICSAEAEQALIQRSCSERIYAFNLRKFKIKIIRALRHYNSPPQLHFVSLRVLLWYPKKSLRCSLARFLRPLRQLTLPASPTGRGRVPCPLSSPERLGFALFYNCVADP